MIDNKTRENIERAVDWMLEFEKTVDYDFLYIYADYDVYGDDEWNLCHYDGVVDAISAVTGVVLEWSASGCSENGKYYGQYCVSKAVPLIKLEELSNNLFKVKGITQVELHRCGTYGHTEKFTKGE